MNQRRRLLSAFAVAAAGAAALVAAWLVAGGALLGRAFDDTQRAAWSELLAAQRPLLVLLVALLVVALAWIGQALYRRWLLPLRRLTEQAQLLLAADEARTIEADGEWRGLARCLQAFAEQRQALRADVARQVAEASRELEQERNRLAALMSELTRSVVVCNLDGRVLLYNARARQQLRALSNSPAAGAELIGLGRSIHAVLDRKLVAHALHSVNKRLSAGAARPSAQFVTLTGSQVLRVQMTPVRSVVGEALDGFVLMIDNITHDFEQQTERDQALHALTEASRASLASLRAAVEILDDPALSAEQRERFIGVVRDETGAMSRRIEQLAASSAAGRTTRWPLEDTLGAELVSAAQQRIGAQLQLPVSADEVDGALWLSLDSFSLLQALLYLATRLRDEHRLRSLQLRLLAADARHAHLDLLWSGAPMSAETAMTWELDAMGGSDGAALSVRDVAVRHGGEFWYERDRTRQRSCFRFLLPLAGEPEADEAAIDSRPEFYDFDLFGAGTARHALDDRPLTELTYTVFDTETTGLRPNDGDRIIQIGAVRVLNGKLLRAECFDQLVDPRRPIPAASIPIHGITAEAVAGQPGIEQVLPAFHAYASDTVLVAHNAAFDMRFLQLQEAATGVRFEQPVLDTLLLSAWLHPNQDSHRLEAIAERFGVAVVNRHTALGDALVTAQVFVKMLPLLAEAGIATLGQAREAVRKSYYARVEY